MASSLRRQVDALRHASSGTSSGYIQRKKGKPSLLLTPDQAAEVDLSSVRETAVMGLQRLEAVDQDFSPFQDTLFSKEAEGTLRDLQTKESNDRIDKSISAFLALLSPHFACREAHFCLEYLIRHYKVYQYNVDAVVECCLPWHDTVAFARMVQLLSLKGSRWEFLTPVQKTGSPLPREAIARRCARDFGLLRFLCVSARRAAARAASCSVATAQSTSTSSVSAATAAGRAKLFSFYAATVVEALASLGTTSDPLLRALVPTVVHGLSATKSPEYQMASYMILSALSGKGPLSLDVNGQALTALVCKPCQGGLEPSLLCALAVAQTQVGFYSKKDPSNSSSAAPLLLPTAAFEKLSGMESLAGVLAGLAQKFDATAFLWLLLQSYVQHLPDQDSRHGESLTRLCTYPYWPSHSLPRLIRRLVDRLIRSYLALTLEGAEDEAAMEVDDAPEKSRRSTAMKTESQTVLRVLSQRYPEEVDAAVAKISRSVAKAKAATAKAALQDDDEGNDAVGVMTGKREAYLKEEALSSLLVSTFAGAQLASHLPLQQQEEDGAPVGDEGREDGAVHGSLIVALEHSSAAVRARAVEQLSRAMSRAVDNDDAAAGESASKSAGGVEDLSPVLLRRLHDEDPDVVLAITESDTLVQQVLLRTRSYPMADDSTGGDGVGGGADDSNVVGQAAVVASAAMTAAGPWLSAISEMRPKHPVASAGRVLCGLVRLAAAASSACGEGESAVVKQARDPALSLLLECLPGPHATARVRSAQRQAVGADGRGDSASEEGATDPAAAAAAAASTGKACKKASRAVGRAAIEAVSRLGVGVEGDTLAGLFAVVGKVLNKSDDEGSGKGSAAKSPGRNNSKKKKSGDADDLEAEGVKSKGLKVMGEEVCDALAAAIVGPGDLDSKNDQLQTLRDICGAGGRWLILECTYRALNLASASSSGGGNAKARAAATAAASSLFSLLASLATSELRLRPHLLSSSPDGDDAKVVGAVGAADLLRYLRACAAHLPRTERSSSLFAEDHLAASASAPSVGGNVDTSVGGDGSAVTPSPLLGDVLVSVLTATAEGGSKGGATAVWEAVSAVVLHGYERRPLPALAAVAIEGVTVAGRRGHGVSRQQPRRVGGVDEAKLVAAARALCVAATFVRAAAEAVASGDTVEDEESSKAAERDIVAVLPAAVLAIASDDEGLRDSGLLFITTVSAHGDALSAESSGSSGGASSSGATKSKPAPSPGPKIEDSEFLPLGQMGDSAAEPSPLNAPSLSSLVELAAALAGKNREAALDAGELTRHLATVLGEAAGGGWQEDVLRYLVAWAARLGWRDPTASALLLECLVWAKTPMRECSLPLLHRCLDSEQARNNQNNERLLDILLGVTLNLAVGDATVAAVAVAVDGREESSRNTKSPKKTTRGSKDKASAAEDSQASASSTIFASIKAEQLMHRALRTPGPAQSHALHCLCVTSAPRCGVGAQPAGEDESTRQRRDLVAVLVEACLAGADGSLVAAAARALPCLPGDMAALLVGLPPLSGAGAGGATPSKGRKKKSSATSKADAATTGTGWVFTLGGLVELAQALCGSSSSSSSVPDHQQQSQSQSHSTKGVRDGRGAVTAGATTSAEGWGWAGPLAIARPLFDVLPSLLAVVTKGAAEEGGSSSAVSGGDVVDAAEYGLWLTMDVLGGVLRRWGKGGIGGGGGSAAAEKLYEGRRAGEDAEMVLACVRENPSPQTRNSALALLSRMATLFPAQMASRLRSLLDAVCAAAAGGEGLSSGGGGGGARAALRQTQKAVQSVVPALKAHGSEAGVGAHFVVQVFVEALDDAPAHARRALFSTLVDSLGEESLAIMSALLLRRAVFSGGPDVGGKSADQETTAALIEFVHQSIHRSRARGQVRTLVGLVQACHRMSVSAAERSGSLSGQALDEAVECFVGDAAANEKGEDQLKTDYLQLPLVQQEPARDKKASTPAFMTMDLRALSEEDSKHMAGNFLELVLSFVRDHLVSRPLVMAVAAAAERGADGKGLSEDEGIQEGFLLLCEELLLFLRTLSVCGRVSSSGSGDEPAWSSLQGLAYAVFETLQSLLSVPSFVAVTQELLMHQDPHLRRKALRMFTRRLDPAEGGGSGGSPRLSPGEESLFVEMLPSLRLVAMGKRSVGGAGEDDDDMGEGIEEVMGPSSPVGGGGPDAMHQDRDADGMKESAVNRQTALLSLDVLARVLGRRHQGAFEGVLGDVTEMVAGVGPGALPAVGQPGSDGILPLRASAFLLVATLCAVLGVRAFPRLPRFFPAMLEALEFQTPLTTAVTDGAAGVGGRGGGRSLLWTSALSAVATVAASLPSFLSPYLGRILAVALRPASAGAGSSGSPSAAGSKQAADRVLSLLATGVEARLLVPAVCGAYAGCVESAKAEEGLGAAGRSIARLLAYVQEIVAGLEKEAASAALPQFTRLLTQALDFRRQHASGSTPQVRESAALVENEASSALVGLVMRLSEVELRPLFLHLCEWKAGVSSGEGDLKATLGALDRRLSFYRVLDGLAGALKSIFTPYFAHVLTDCCDDMEAASLLTSVAANGSPAAAKKKKKRKRAREEASSKRKRRKTLSSGDASDSDEEIGEGDDGEGEDTPELRWRRSAASRLVLSALHRCFQSDRSGFVNKARFELVLPAVVAQLECGSDFSAAAAEGGAEDDVSSCRLHAEELVGPCLAQLASASGKDALWKALANAVLMKTRSRRAGVRVAALVSLRQCFEVVGEEFLALLPECLPFLSELLEDGHPEVESECRALVKYIEGVLGESIESYLV
ncbi:unnamed protein product [Ectocarpus sp. 6 AP-2014]